MQDLGNGDTYNNYINLKPACTISIRNTGLEDYRPDGTSDYKVPYDDKLLTGELYQWKDREATSSYVPTTTYNFTGITTNGVTNALQRNQGNTSTALTPDWSTVANGENHYYVMLQEYKDRTGHWPRYVNMVGRNYVLGH